MKIFRYLSAAISIFMLILLLIGFMVYNAIDRTVLSGDYISDSMVKSGVKNIATDYLIYKAKNSLPEGHMQFNNIEINEIIAKLTDSIDRKWFEEASDKTVKGVYNYIVLESDRLPVLDIQPLKNTLVNELTDELLKRREVKTAFTSIKTAAVMLNGPYKSFIKNGVISDAFLDSILKKPEIKALGFDGDFLSKVIAKYSGISDVKTDTSGIEREIIYGLVANLLKVDSISNDFDINIFLEKAYGSSDNPLARVRNQIGLLKRLSLRIFVVAGICLLLLPLLAWSRPLKLYKGMFVTAAFCGLAAIAAGVFGIATSFTGEIINAAISDSKLPLQLEPESINILRSWLTVLINGYFNTLIIQGVIALITGMVLFFLLNCFDKSLGVEDRRKKDNGQKYQLFSILGSYALIAVIVVNTYISIAGIIGSAGNIANSSTVGTEIIEKPDFAGALADTLNAGFIKDFMK